MKTKAIIRIVIHSTVFLLLLGILLTALGLHSYSFRFDPKIETQYGDESEFVADEITSLHIEWVAGDIMLQLGEVETITVTEESNQPDNRDRMVCVRNGQTLNVRYSDSPVNFSLNAVPSKDLTITVPKDWKCKELEIDVAASKITVQDLIVDEFDIDGAANQIQFTGIFNQMDCDGAATEINAILQNTPNEIDLDGASIDMELTLPQDTGFQINLDGLSCRLSSDYDTAYSRDKYFYGDGRCKIIVDGLSCNIAILKGVN